jgi:PAS domain S-box-containing protein
MAELPDATLALVEVLPVQVWTARPDGLLDFVSARAAADFGIPAPKLVEEGWLQVVHPDDVQQTVERWTHSLSTGETYRIEFRLRRHTGQYEWYLACAEPQRDAAGNITRWVGSNTNIHEQHELQSHTRALLEQVAEQARDTEAMLMELKRARDAAEARVRELEGR